MDQPAYKLPSGPKGKWRTTLKLIRSPRDAFAEWTDKYGDPFYFHALNGPVVVTGRAELIREIFAHDPMEFDAFAQEALRPMLGAGSMLMLSGETHRRERKLIMPMFHGDRMRAYAEIIRDATRQCLAYQPSGQTFEMLDVTTQISLRVIVQAIFGGENRATVERLLDLARNVVRYSAPILFFSPKLHRSFLGISPWDKFVRAQSNLRDAIEEEIARRKADPADREDILTLLLDARYEDGTGIDPEHAFDELGTFLFAGHETSALAMAWAVYHLLRNPDKLEALCQELDAAGDVSAEEMAKLPYLKAVVQETLRLHPIVTEVLRLLKSPMKLGEYYLPAGVAVAPAAVMAHYNEDNFESAETFRPERFLGQSYTPAQYMPFGGGHRRCAGAAFASYEIAIALGTMFQDYRFELREPKPVVPKRGNITMGPSTGIRVSGVRRD